MTPAITPRHVEIVCTGNICRSPMAATVLRDQLARGGVRNVEVTSSGTGAWHTDQPMDPRAADVLRERGLDPDSHRARQFEAGWFEHRDLVLALDASHLEALRALSAPEFRHLIQPFDTTDVDDPYCGAPAGFEQALRQIEAASQQWVRRIRDGELWGAEDCRDSVAE